MHQLSYILLFDFNVKYIPGKYNVIVDALLQKTPGVTNMQELSQDQHIENAIKSYYEFWFL